MPSDLAALLVQLHKETQTITDAFGRIASRATAARADLAAQGEEAARILSQRIEGAAAQGEEAARILSQHIEGAKRVLAGSQCVCTFYEDGERFAQPHCLAAHAKPALAFPRTPTKAPR